MHGMHQALVTGRSACATCEHEKDIPSHLSKSELQTLQQGGRTIWYFPILGFGS
jgi:hypothetical protein